MKENYLQVVTVVVVVVVVVEVEAEIKYSLLEKDILVSNLDNSLVDEVAKQRKK